MAGLTRFASFGPLWLAAGLALGACGGGADVIFGLDPDTKGAVVVVDDGPDRLVAGLDPDGDPFTWRQETPEPVTVTVLEYPHTLYDLGLAAGPLVQAEDDEGLSLLPPARVHSALSTGGGAPDFSELDEVPGEVLGVRIELPTVIECVAAGGCYGSRPDDGATICKIPCAEPSAPIPPQPAALPQLHPCASGWTLAPAASADDVQECLPWPAARTCEPGSAQRPGDAECTLVGPACPAGPWPDALPSDPAARFVSADATGPGDGSRPRPHRTIGEALAATTATSAVIVLSVGRHPLPAAWPGAVELVGACSAGTVLEGRWPASPTRARLGGLGVEVAVRLGEGDTLDAAGVSVRSTVGPVLLAGEGSELRLDDAMVEVDLGAAIEATGDAEVTAHRVRFEGGGVTARSGARMTVTDSAIRGASTGVLIESGSAAALARVAIDRSQSSGFIVRNSGSALELRDVVVTSPKDLGTATGAVVDGGNLSGRRILIQGGHALGLAAEAGNIAVEDLVVRDTYENRVTLVAGTGLQVTDGSTVILRRALILRSRGFGVLALERDTDVRLQDTNVRVVVGLELNGEKGTGIAVEEQAEIAVERVRVERPHGAGVVVEREGVLTGADLYVQDVLPRDSNGAYGRGIEVGKESQVDLRRVVIERAKNIGLHVLDPGTYAHFEDLRVAETGRSECFEFSCNSGVADGATVILQAALEIRRFVVEDNGQFGVRVVNQSRLSLQDGVIANHPVGAQIIVDDYDLGELAHGVLFRGNNEDFSLLGR